MAQYTLAIDQGTTSTRSMIFDANLQVVASAQQEFPQHFPASGWVEHDPEDIWQSCLDTLRSVLAKSGVALESIAGIGITNQRETTLLWDRQSGQALHNAIVWQDRRTADYCESLRQEGLEAELSAKTGLLLDPYFSATKLRWLLDHVEGARRLAEQGRLAFGTVDCFLIWRLSGGVAHVTDATNAARTALYNVVEGCWDQALLDAFDIPFALMPEVRDCAAEFAQSATALLGQAVPIRGVAGDQQAATIGQGCFDPGMVKATYGTGCFALLNTGQRFVQSEHRLLSTIAYQFSGQATYALEGSIFIAGAAVQWLRDALKIIGSAEQSQALAQSAKRNSGVVFVPAFTGLGAPYWNADCRGAIFGLDRDTGAAEITRAALKSVAFQTRDLIGAMAEDWGELGSDAAPTLRVDGGMVSNDYLVQTLADLLQADVDRPRITETTALGAAYLAGMQAGLYPGIEAFAKTWALDRRFEAQMSASEADRQYAQWQDAVARLLSS